MILPYEFDLKFLLELDFFRAATAIAALLELNLDDDKAPLPLPFPPDNKLLLWRFREIYS